MTCILSSGCNRLDNDAAHCPFDRVAPQIRAEAAYLYDAVFLYAHALREILLEGGDPYDGLAVMERIRGRAYMSAMG